MSNWEQTLKQSYTHCFLSSLENKSTMTSKKALFVCLGKLSTNSFSSSSSFVFYCILLFYFDGVLFLLGNICRSPIAEAVFIDEVKKTGQESQWEIGKLNGNFELILCIQQ